MAQADDNGPPMKRKKKWRDFDARLHELKAQLRQGTITQDAYFDAVCGSITRFN